LAADAATPIEAPAPAVPATSVVGYDEDHWEALVSADPCEWLPTATLSALGMPLEGTLETLAAETRCVWTDAEGGTVFSASIQRWDGPANIVGERQSQIALAAEMGGFRQIEGGSGTVTGIYRTSRGSLVLFPNADDQSVLVALNARKTARDDEATKAAKDERANAFAQALIEAYGL
jgi:hypothetical protein